MKIEFCQDIRFIHADANIVGPQNGCKTFTGELTSLIRIEYLWRAQEKCVLRIPRIARRAKPLKTRRNSKTVVPEKTCGETGCLFSNGGGLAACSQKPLTCKNRRNLLSAHWKSAQHSFLPAPSRRNPFLHVFPKQRMDAGSIHAATPLDVLT